MPLVKTAALTDRLSRPARRNRRPSCGGTQPESERYLRQEQLASTLTTQRRFVDSRAHGARRNVGGDMVALGLRIWLWIWLLQ